jgi:CRP-like cAMP-binding protein
MVYRVDVRHVSHFLEDVDLFRGLSVQNLDRVAGLCEEWEFAEGQILGVQNEPGHRIFILREGQIKVTSGTSERAVVVRTVREHEAFPVAVLFDPPLLITTSQARTSGSAFVIPRVRLMELCELVPRIGMHIYRAASVILVSRYRYTLDMLADPQQEFAEIAPRSAGGEI